MAPRKVYRAVPASAQRQVQHKDVALFTHATKQLAIEGGRRVAQANAPSQLVVHRTDGTIETEWTYGNDLCLPLGRRARAPSVPAAT